MRVSMETPSQATQKQYHRAADRILKEHKMSSFLPNDSTVMHVDEGKRAWVQIFILVSKEDALKEKA